VKLAPLFAEGSQIDSSARERERALKTFSEFQASEGIGGMF